MSGHLVSVGFGGPLVEVRVGTTFTLTPEDLPGHGVWNSPYRGVVQQVSSADHGEVEFTPYVSNNRLTRLDIHGVRRTVLRPHQQRYDSNNNARFAHDFMQRYITYSINKYHFHVIVSEQVSENQTVEPNPELDNTVVGTCFWRKNYGENNS